MAWLAGLLEGEGYFGIIKNNVGGKVYRYPRIGVNMTDRDVIDRVGVMWGVKTYVMPQVPGRKVQYRVSVSGHRAAEWMRQLLPWMGSRRAERITDVLNEWDGRESANSRRIRACRCAAAQRQRHSDGTFKAYH